MSGRYYPSFQVHQREEIKKAFLNDGFVVVDNVLTEEECKKSIEEVWKYIEKDGLVKRDALQTWDNWPKEICRNGGFMGRFPYWKRIQKLDPTHINQQEQAWRNRENKQIYSVFANLLDTHKLWVSVDRYGVMRPTRYRKTTPVSFSDVVHKPEWRTKEDWLHWDLSPFHFATSAAGFAPSEYASNREELKNEYGSLRVQGLVTLVDCPVEVGGFHCVPGFTGDEFFQWALDNQEYGNQPEVYNRNFNEVPPDDPMRKRIMKVPMRAGSLLIWNSQLPHGNFPNESFQFRMVHYIKMIPVDDAREFQPAVRVNKFVLSDWFPPSFTPSPLGRRLFGIDEWTEEDKQFLDGEQVKLH